jgi:hypothetical protein
VLALAGTRAGKATTRRQTKAQPPKKRLPRSTWLFIIVAVVGVIAFARLYPRGQPPPHNAGTPRALIVDQLSSMQTNDAFISEVSHELGELGFQVDLYQLDEITVDFYRQLPTHGYKLIILRAHSGILGEGEQVHVQTLLFTNEDYSRWTHQADQLQGRLHMATVGEGYPIVFGIPPEFITSSMQGRFDDTIVIMMGCAGMFIPDLAIAFIEKGAAVYLAWNATVDLDYVDRATSYLIRQLCSEGMTIEEAVANTMAAIGRDPTYSAELKYYPAASGDRMLERPAV